MAAKLLYVSFDSTLKSNLSVGLPLDMQFYELDSLTKGYEKRVEATDPLLPLDFRRLVRRIAFRLQQPAGFQARLIFLTAQTIRRPETRPDRRIRQ
jgi:predicted proteasome-type protease